jgi:guanylate kinase
MPSEEAPSPIILIIIGPAGSGKTTLCERLLEEFPDRIARVVTTTTRQPRPGEIDGVDYHFLSREAFQAGIRDSAFIEWAEVHGRFYGSQKIHIHEMIRSGKDLLLNIDIQGARSFSRDPSINAVLPGRIHTVFIKPRSLEQIRQRLQNRGSDNEEEICRRLKTAALEIEAASDFDHVIVSGSREADYEALRELYLALRK